MGVKATGEQGEKGDKGEDGKFIIPTIIGGTALAGNATFLGYVLIKRKESLFDFLSFLTKTGNK